MRARIPELGLYVHIPFCVRKCHYCDFNSGPVSQRGRQIYLRALQREISDSPLKATPVRTVFFGGGTPSELSIPELGGIVERLCETFVLGPGAEWTIECNPGTVSLESLGAYREMGFNRISLGVQSFHDRHLEALGRLHNADEARQACRWVREAGFDNLNIDLIFALPEQTFQEWQADLSEALNLVPQHLSLYQLTIEAGTEFGHRYARGELRPADEDLSADMYELAMDQVTGGGYEHYEISNFALPGRKCAHNLIYWRNQPYLGFGVSAASFLEGSRWTNTANLAEYASSVGTGRVSRGSQERLGARRALGEEIMLGLRTAEGISLSALSKRYSYDVPALFAGTLQFLLHQDLIRRTGNQVMLSRRGKMLANTVCAEFL